MATKQSIVARKVVLLHNLDPDWPQQDLDDALRETVRLGAALEASGHEVTYVPVMSADLEAAMESCDPAACIVFNWCEELPGVPHSEPLVAAMLEAAGYVYTGASGPVLALAQDKPRVKQVLAACEVPTPRGIVADRGSALNGWRVFPAIVKPAYEHCSLGMSAQSVVFNARELAEQVARVHDTFAQPALVEEFIEGREFRVAFLGNRRLELLPPVEMDFSRLDDVRERICGYDAKFMPSSKAYREIQTIVPAPLSEGELERLRQVCAVAYRAVGCRDYGRIDVRMQGDTFYVLDVNPNPDLSADASLACAAEYRGYSYGALGARIVQLAASRSRRASGVASPRRVLAGPAER
ncbi:MAG: hypothetical protein N2595_04795 [bacterium]|nr:hypothetical protein [bacterium]